MIEVNFQDKTINFIQSETEDFGDISACAEILGGVMFYPDEPEKIKNYINGSNLHSLIASDTTRDEYQEIAKTYPDFLYEIIANRYIADKAFNDCWTKSGKGLNRHTKGVISGALLELLSTGLYNMTEVYTALGKNPELLQWQNSNKNKTPNLKRKTIEDIWNCFKHVSHFWWAYNTLYQDKKILLFKDIQCSSNHKQRGSEYFEYFLSYAANYRRILIDKHNPTSNSNVRRRDDHFQIKDPESLWNPLINGCPINTPHTRAFSISMPISQALTRKFPLAGTPTKASPLFFISPEGKIEPTPEHDIIRYTIHSNEISILRPV